MRPVAGSVETKYSMRSYIYLEGWILFQLQKVRKQAFCLIPHLPRHMIYFYRDLFLFSHPIHRSFTCEIGSKADSAPFIISEL